VCSTPSSFAAATPPSGYSTYISHVGQVAWQHDVTEARAAKQTNRSALFPAVACGGKYVESQAIFLNLAHRVCVEMTQGEVCMVNINTDQQPDNL